MHRLVTACCAVPILLSLVALVWSPPTGPHVPADGLVQPPVSLEPDVVIIGDATVEEQARLDEALAGFRAAGLALPDVEVRFSTHSNDCAGHYGLFQERFEPWRITICSDVAFVMLHEFGHAWERANLDVTERAAYAAERGFPTWNSPDFPREERAAEEAAFVLQQHLSRTHRPDSERWRDLTAAYDLLLELAHPVAASS